MYNIYLKKGSSIITTINIIINRLERSLIFSTFFSLFALSSFISIIFLSKADEMRQFTPKEYKNMNCCFASLKTNISNLESALCGRIRNSKQEAKRNRAFALLTHLETYHILPIAYSTFFEIFKMRICFILFRLNWPKC